MDIKRQRTIAQDIFKTLNYLNPNFVKGNFYISSHKPHRRHDISVQSPKTTKYGAKSLRGFGPRLELNAIVNFALSNPLYT